MTPIPHIPLITVEPRPLNQRLWQLVHKERAGTLTPDEKAELDALCDRLEREDDSIPVSDPTLFDPRQAMPGTTPLI